jgi:alpha-mannosidase
MNQRAEEWNKRISIWVEELQNHLYIELHTVNFDGYFTKERLSYEEAMEQSFVSMLPGSSWGEKWEYGWFRINVVLSKEAQGKRIYFIPKTGGESLAWVNGKIACAVDLQHDGIMLTDSGKAGDSFTIVLESYAGHGPRLENGGPYPPERIAVPEPPKHQVVVGTSSYGLWNQEAFELAMDVGTLYKLYQVVDPKSLRYAKIKDGLQEFTKIVDFELPLKERNTSYIVARQVLQPLLSCVNGSTMPEFTIFGQSHLDLAWKWHWEETRRKCARTYSNQLTLSDEYPDYKFLVCEPVILESIKKDYPELYPKIKEKVNQGKFLPEGGVWVEPDTNIPSGESLIRQCVWGKRWFQKEFGYDTKMVWLPDCFGFSGQLPQIMIGTGMKYFTTQKIARALKGNDKFPYNIFMWQGIDGTEILTHFYNKNNSRYNPQLLVERWNNDRVQQENIETFLFPFGFGDGGGGPTREMLEMVRRTKDLEGVPRTKIQSPIAFFEEIEQKGNVKNRYVGELYLAWHRGTYTVQAKAKKGNRLAEVALRELEFWGTLAIQQDCVLDQDQDSILDQDQDSILDQNQDSILNQNLESIRKSNYQFPRKVVNKLWEKLLFNQFHDILAGTSITRVQQEAEQDFELIVNDAKQLCDNAFAFMVGGQKKTDYEHSSIVLFNSLSWKRWAFVELPEHETGALDSRNRLLESQIIEGKTFVRAKMPACGYTTIYPFQEEQNTEDENNPEDEQNSKDEHNFENEQNFEDKQNFEDNQNSEDELNFEDSQNSEVELSNELELESINNKIYVSQFRMENEFLRIQFNDCGDITSIYDKVSNMEYASGLCNHFCMYQDINVDYDAWELSNFHEELPVELNNKAKVEVIASGNLFGTIRVSKKVNCSELIQDITLYAGSRRVDFKTKIDWQETHKILKVEFPVQIFAQEALQEIQFGYVNRPTHRSRQYDADRFEVCNHRYTALTEVKRCFAVLNDSKYGVSTNENKIQLSLLRAPLIPDMYADKGKQEFTYAFYAAPCSFFDSEIIRQGYELNMPVGRFYGEADEKSFFELDASGVILETVKMAEDGTEDIILRLYEAKKNHENCRMKIHLSFDRIYEANMLEQIQMEMEFQWDERETREVELVFRPFEIKTLRVVCKK